MMGSRLIAIAPCNSLYRRSAGVWSVISPDPSGWTTDGFSRMIVGDPNGGFVIFRDTGHFCHFDGDSAWTYLAQASAETDFASGCAVDASHIYAFGVDGCVEKFNGTAWSDLTSGGALDGGAAHGWAQSADVLWCCNRDGYLWHYTGSWSDEWAALTAVLTTVTKAMDVWTCGSNVYVLCLDYVNDLSYVAKWDGANWTQIGASITGASTCYLHSIWGTDDSHIWVNGRTISPNDAVVYFWNGATWAAQYASGTPTGNQTDGKSLFGESASVVCSTFQCGFATPNVLETANGASWASPSWPDAHEPYGIGVETYDDSGPAMIGNTGEEEYEFCSTLLDGKDLELDSIGRLTRDYTVASRARMRLLTKRGHWVYDAEMGSRLHEMTTREARTKALAIVTEALQPLIDEGEIIKVEIGQRDIDERLGAVGIEVFITTPSSEPRIAVGTFRTGGE